MRRLAFVLVLLACSSKAPPKQEPAPLAPGEENATEAQCQAALEKMAAVMPESLDPDPAVNLADCRKLPSKLVTCLATIDSKAAAEACSDATTR